ncbi:MAG: alternative ribosome rescue aminoacyl-tRNA hydrolase ArfB [Gemmatimonadaceae bacterium]
MDPDDLIIDETHTIPAAELVYRATRSGGAGGQHVNTSSTRIELLWEVGRSSALTDEERAVVQERLSARLDATGAVRIVSSETRSQLQNRERAKARLGELVRQALVPRKTRRRTRPSRAAREERLADKKQRSKRKSDRRQGNWE